jgi:glycosyltransferase involved in cell wall biosynthesis
LKILSLTKYGKLGASSRLRTLQYLALLERENINVSSHALISDKALTLRYKFGYYSFLSLIFFYINRIKTLIFKKSFDLVWIEKESLPWFPAWIELLLLGGKPFVLDYDDATFHNYDKNDSKILRYFFHDRLDRLMAKSSLVICGNSYLQKRAKSAGALHTVILPTVIDLDKYLVKEYKNPLTESDTNYRIKIVWIGSPSTQHYLELIKEPLQALSNKYGFSLRVIGPREFSIPSVNVETFSWSEETESELIRNCDIGIMPLFNTSWEKGKCGYKLIQYMASGLPVIASPVGINKDIVRCDNGFLASNDNDWISSLDSLLSNASLRCKMGLCGRKYVVEKYSLEATTPNLVENFREIHKKMLERSGKD